MTSVATAASSTATGDQIMTIPAVSLPAHAMAIGLTSTTAGPRPWADSGTVFGVVGHADTGTYSTQAGVSAFEGVAYSGMATPAKVAMGHSMPPMNMTASGFPAAPTGPNGDLANSRLAYVSWPSQGSWPGGQNAGDGDPAGWLLKIQNGNYDDWIAYFALALKNWGHPTIVRLMWEMDGGDPPWAAGHQTNLVAPNGHTFAQWSAAFIGAWRRIFTIVRGTQAAVTALSPGYGANLRVGATAISTINGGNAIQATNAYFHYNPQFAPGSQSTIGFDAPWPGDAFVHFAGLEAYRPLVAIPGQTNRDFTNIINAHDQSSTGNNVAFYTEYGPGGTRNQTLSFMGNGEGGVRYQADTTIAANFATGVLSGVKANPAWKFYVYWDGGSVSGNGLSTIDGAGMPAAVVTAVQTWLQDSWMLPNLNVTWDVNTVGPWTSAYQSRRQVATNNACFGPNMLASMMAVNNNASSSPTTAPTLSPGAYGFGNWTSISFALNPA